MVNMKAIPVRVRGNPWSCKTSRLPYFLDNRLTDDGDVTVKTLLVVLFKCICLSVLTAHFLSRYFTSTSTSSN
jgi:hypothetical protein